MYLAIGLSGLELRSSEKGPTGSKSEPPGCSWDRKLASPINLPRDPKIWTSLARPCDRIVWSWYRGRRSGVGLCAFSP